jgi:shikimate kinase
MTAPTPSQADEGGASLTETPAGRAGGEPARAKAVVLVGPKGAGKTTIGRMVEAALGARFVEVEAVARRALAEAGGAIDEAYARRAFGMILEEVEAAARGAPAVVLETTGAPAVVLETTGASAETPRFLAALRERFETVLVRVTASRAVCERRIAGRDQARQIQVGPDLVREMHARSLALSLAWDVEIDNEAGVGEAEVVRALRPYLLSRPGRS